MHYKNTKGNSKVSLKIVLKKRLYSPLCTFTVVWLLTRLTYTQQIEHVKKLTCLFNVGFCQQIEHAKKSTCLFNVGFCQPMCLTSLML